jgi:redox-sensitive bicupin YhaK (pirin superfamily)
MSWNPALDAHIPTGAAIDGIETVIVPRARDLGGFEVRRALPAPQRQMVGPFIFFDQMGPAELLVGGGIDVRPHPHIGLGTVTYLYDGAMYHRDSLGHALEITPGAVNWMVAGSGITHSEREAPERKAAPRRLFGIQTWVALPDEAEDVDPHFDHHPAETLPLMQAEGKTVRLIMGEAWRERAPVRTYSPMFYADAVLEAGAHLPLPDGHEDRGLYVAAGSVTIAGQDFDAGRMLVFRPGDRMSALAGPQGARVLLLGGDTFPGPRHIWWNFVASSKERIDAAREAWRAGDWQHGRFRLPPGDDAEYIPLP